MTPDFQSNLDFARPFSYHEDFGHSLTVGTDASKHSGDIAYGCCKQPFAKKGAVPFRFHWDL